MRVLLLGGTWFLGRATANEVLARGWELTVFTRGRSGPAPTGAVAVTGDRTSRYDLSALAGRGPWDVVIDTSATDMAPREVLTSATLLEPVAGAYVFVSTVNVYRDWPDKPLDESSEVLDAPADADAEFGRLPADWTGPDWYYGRQKAGAEKAVRETFGEWRSVILRPGVILGPGEYVGRLPWWLTRAARGGTILGPGDPGRRIQPVDVRDLASFALDRAAAAEGGSYNVTAPGDETFGDLLDACVEVTGRRGTVEWVADEVLVDAGIRQWTELPLWRTNAGVWAVDSSAARAVGLSTRPIRDTVHDTWRWMQAGGRPVDNPRWHEHGISAENEARVLRAARLSAVQTEVSSPSSVRLDE
ncbi:NAD-dependent epimerase/dehydratase family protein [Pseudofrankia sp. BMG5.36]|uniref:NAD-dependent epimerase/dehydratase family protein n=1 Tax=Pseudofrankia sp. BMG5.36 TaxID=1834512 RepID=UPI0008DA305B|nr:NAD-dependent epimerase/dehydratase family protein [Pseudofrankia sp. BMG5.36]OHV63670.1 NAD-dependent epimerase [Pseudofrankia sp. BMG5.36]